MLRWLYPITCEICGEPAERSLCPSCLAKLERVPRPICLYCGASLQQTPESTDRCEFCQGQPRPFAVARSAFIQTERTMELVYRLKYHRAPYLADGLAPAMAELWQTTAALQAFSQGALIPVPVTRSHLCRRGYNQAEELARAVGKLLSLPVINALQRHENDHDSQTRLSSRQRLLNAYDSFTAAPAFLSGKRRLPEYSVLIDDVFTTGATARACCRALLGVPGVRDVAVVTLMRATHRK